MAGQKRDYPRAARLSTQLQDELSQLLRANLIHDPRVAGVMITVTKVDVVPDMSHAHVFVSTLGDDAQLLSTVQGLNHAAGKLRHEVGTRLHIRYVPLLRFVADAATREGDRVSALLNKALAEDRAAAAARGEPEIKPAKP